MSIFTEIILVIGRYKDMVELLPQVLRTYRARVWKDTKRLWQSPGMLTNLDIKLNGTIRALAGCLKIVDLAANLIPYVSRGNTLLNMRIALVDNEKLFNSAKENVRTVVARLQQQEAGLRKMTNPKDLPTDPGFETDLAAKLHLMTTAELENKLLMLLIGQPPAIESMAILLKGVVIGKGELLVKFLDVLSANPVEMGHHFRSAVKRVEQIKISIANLRSLERQGALRSLLTSAYEYKALMREIFIRWN